MVNQNIVAFICADYKGEILYYRQDHLLSPWVEFDFHQVTVFNSIIDAEKALDTLMDKYPRIEMGIKYLEISESSLKSLIGGKITLEQTERLIGDKVGIIT